MRAREPHLLDPLPVPLSLPRRPLALHIARLPPPPKHRAVVPPPLIERKRLQRDPDAARHVRGGQPKAVELRARHSGRGGRGREARRAQERRPAARADRVERGDALDQEALAAPHRPRARRARALRRALAPERLEQRADGGDRAAVVGVAGARVRVERGKDAREEVQGRSWGEEPDEVDEAGEEADDVGAAREAEEVDLRGGRGRSARARRDEEEEREGAHLIAVLVVDAQKVVQVLDLLHHAPSECAL